MLGLVWAVAAAFWVAVFLIMSMNGGVRMKDGSVVGRQQTQQEFDEKLRRIKEREARYEKWRKNLGR
jgi:hypothetical protein